MSAFAGLVTSAVRAPGVLLRGRPETVRRPAYVAASTAQAVYLPAAAPGLGTSGVHLLPVLPVRRRAARAEHAGPR